MASARRDEQVQRGGKVGFVSAGRPAWEPSTITDLFMFFFSPRDAPLALVAIKSKCPSVAISALCGPYVWVLIERGLLCLGHR